MRKLLNYFTNLRPGKLVLWCYLIWYLATVATHFDASPAIWLNSLGISAVIGVALMLSVSRLPGAPVDHWQTLRLFLMPFCVSSFSALIKGQGYFLVFPPDWRDLLVSAGACAAFVAIVAVLKQIPGRPS